MDNSGLTLLYQFAKKKMLGPTHGLGPTLDITNANGTVVNAQGFIEAVPDNTARFDHDPVTGESLGLLVEEARTNLCLQSEDFETTWVNTGSNTTYTAAAGIAPDGATTATDVLHGDTSEDTRQTVTVVADTAYTFSIFLHSGTTGAHDWVWVVYQDNAAGNGVDAWFDLTSAGAVGTSRAFGAGATLGGTSVTDYGNGWYRVSITGTLASGITAGRLVLTNVDADGSATADATNSVWYWGAQLEAGAFPTSYIPTTTTSVTRNLDDIQTADVSWLTSATGTVYSVASLPYVTSAAGIIFEAQAGTNVERILLWNDSNAPNNRIIDASTVQAQIIVGTNYDTADSVVRQAMAYATDDVMAYVDGTAGTPDTTAVMPTEIDTLHIGADGFGTSVFNGHIKEIRYYNERKPDQFLEDLSAGRIAASIGAGNAISRANNVALWAHMRRRKREDMEAQKAIEKYLNM